MGFLESLIIGGVISGIIIGIRFLIWKEEIPETISKLRWVIAIAIGIIIIFIEINVGFTPKSQIINAFIIYLIAQVLDNDY